MKSANALSVLLASVLCLSVSVFAQDSSPRPLAADCAPGDIVLFGSYEQDNDASNGKEAIEWIVLEKDDEKATLLSLYGLDSKPYNVKPAGISWETCTLREWMNGEFLTQAFSEEENALIETVTVEATPNPEHDIQPGNDTEDKVWFLSVQEADTYFASDEERICTPTSYATAQGAYTDDAGSCWWWLRTRGRLAPYTTRVGCDGSIFYQGSGADIANYTVRPAIAVQVK